MKSIIAVAAFTISLGTLPALADGTPPAGATALDISGTDRKPVLCALWMLQNMAEQAGLHGQSAATVAQTSYPVPAPIWIMSNLLGVETAAR
jgi:hypothetical protein